MEEVKRKKRVILHTDFALAKTGFGRYAFELLSHLYKTEKYELISYACGIPQNAPQLQLTPWITEGAINTAPDVQQKMQQDPNYARMVSYGGGRIDEIIQKYKPDVLISSNDIWAFDYFPDKAWFNKITSCLTVTLDSLPILPSAITTAKKSKNFWCWASFATEEMHKMGLTHVKTVHGPVNKDQYYKLPDDKIKELRRKNNISDDCFVAVFSSRNQLRKLFPNVIQGWKIFRDRNPEIKNAKLLFHTFLGEGWRLYSLAKEYGVDPKDILVTYVCRNCHEYQIKSADDRQTSHEVDEQGRPKIDKDGKFIEKEIQLHDKDCPHCGAQKGQITPSVGFGVSTSQMNEIFNIADVGLQIFTSGGQEYVAQEVALCEKIVIATDYSCGTDICGEGSYTLPVESSYYFEHGTEFRKASAIPSSIAKQLTKVYKMTPADRKKWGEKARQYIINKYDINVIGKIYEDFIDAAPYVDENDPKNFMAGEEKQWNPHAQLPPTNSDEEFVIQCYHKILSSDDVAPGHPDLNNWVSQLKNGQMTREKLEVTFRNIAAQELQKKQTIDVKDLFIKNGKKNFLVVAPQSAGDCLYISATLKSFRESYPSTEWNIHLATQPEFMELFESCEYIDKILPYQPFMDSELFCLGQRDKKWLDGYCFPAVNAQKVLNYLGNNNVNIKIQD